MRRILTRLLGLGAILALIGCERGAEEINVYSARHYDSDAKLYAAFEEATGIKVKRAEAQGDLLIEKLKAEGASSPADIVITVDAGRLDRAKAAGLLAPIADQAILERVPAHLRDPDGAWVAMSKRARVIVHRKGAVAPTDVATYESLADPRWKGRLCVRSSANDYNLSLLAALIGRWGPERAEAWAKGVRDNFARPPTGGDTDQIRAVAAGACDVALVNHYYFARLLNSEKPEDRAVVDAVGLVWPDQDGAGAHVNISGISLAKNAPHRAAALRFIAFTLADAQQTMIASTNNELPATTGAPTGNRALEALGPFKDDEQNLAKLGPLQPQAAEIFDRVGWP